MKSFHGRVAVVTGAGSGIGRATSELLATRGCDLAIVDMSETAAEETKQLVERAGRRATVHVLDVRDVDALAALPSQVEDAHGAAHILVNNAGVTSAGSFEHESIDDLNWIVDINVWGVVHGCRFFLPLLKAAGEAHIVNLSSMVGLVGFGHNVSYSLSKGAVRSFTEALRGELITTNVGVTAVFPGAIRTNITNSARGDQAGRLADMGRSRLAPLVMRPPSKVAGAIVRGIERNRPRVVVGPDAHFISAVSRIAPGRSGLLGRVTARAESPSR
ncbi:MAG: SDR family NAD(P)-dependent oxidoreductase [Microthrixaceae bacterium]